MCGVIFFEKICIPSLKLVKPGPHCGRERNHPGSDAVPYEEPDRTADNSERLCVERMHG